jgi:hypothetical protein
MHNITLHTIFRTKITTYTMQHQCTTLRYTPYSAKYRHHFILFHNKNIFLHHHRNQSQLIEISTEILHTTSNAISHTLNFYLKLFLHFTTTL